MLRRRHEDSGELDDGLRDDLFCHLHGRQFEAEARGMVAGVEFLGQPVTKFAIADDRNRILKVYLPQPNARLAGYVPELWLEFMLQGAEDGTVLEVRSDQVGLVRLEDAGEGFRPAKLPISNTRVVLTRATDILRDGGLIDPVTFEDVA